MRNSFSGLPPITTPAVAHPFADALRIVMVAHRMEIILTVAPEGVHKNKPATRMNGNFGRGPGNADCHARHVCFMAAFTPPNGRFGTH